MDGGDKTHSYTPTTAALPYLAGWLAGATMNSFRRAHVAIFQLVRTNVDVFEKKPKWNRIGRSDASAEVSIDDIDLTIHEYLLHCSKLEILYACRSTIKAPILRRMMACAGLQ